ncbi:cytochrome B6 [Methylocaldum sp.]|uniref:cytochrome B6 n=1 Tax=Methylocaldum sp. TaxID=1969727 RepID=UPI002D60BDAA|nr:cytochrome B6 [Methylocaldum sp.]HYE37666.1 cytochrome B6 [Methylocaldum sp.]
MQEKALEAVLRGFVFLSLAFTGLTMCSDAPARSAEEFQQFMADMKTAKLDAMERHLKVLDERYDLSDNPSKTVTMTRGKPVQEGVRVKIREVVTWDKLAEMTPEEIRKQDLFPKGFMPLPHPNPAEGGIVFSKNFVEAIEQQEGRDLARFDVGFDIPERFQPELPPPVFLKTQTDRGDVSRGQLITLSNYRELFDGVINPEQLEGLRLLLTPFPQQQFNATDDRRSENPSPGIACFDCHVNGHTGAAIQTVPSPRPREPNLRIDTPSLRGVEVQQLFGSQGMPKSIEDYSEFKLRTAYLDENPAATQEKEGHIPDRNDISLMAGFQKLIDFPPAPKLDTSGKLDPQKNDEAALRGQDLFFGKAQCATCHTPPYYTDNRAHDLQVERFYRSGTSTSQTTAPDGPIKTFPLRGIKDSPPYLHDGRLLTLEDTVEFFNLVLGLKLTKSEKQDLLAFLVTL